MLTLEGMPWQMKVHVIAVGAFGLLSVLFGALPVPVALRAIGGILAGTGALFATLVITTKPNLVPFEGWRLYAFTAGVVMLPAGLLVRSQYKGAIVGRLFGTIGALALLAVLLVPVGGKLPMIAAIDAGSAAKNTFSMLSSFFPLIFALLALGGLLTWLPKSTSMGGTFFAWLAFISVMLLGVLRVGTMLAEAKWEMEFVE